MSDDRFDNRRYHNEDTFSIQSTAGAVPVRNKKGEISMEKVKVNRYVSGKKVTQIYSNAIEFMLVFSGKNLRFWSILKGMKLTPCDFCQF